jgi:hypothetical protein
MRGAIGDLSFLYIAPMNMFDIIKDLEEEGIFIDFHHEYYEDGSNCIFQIHFRNYDYTTYLFGDNHEFGDTAETMVAAIKLANWYHDFPLSTIIETKKDVKNNLNFERELSAFLKTLMK